MDECVLTRRLPADRAGDFDLERIVGQTRRVWPEVIVLNN